MAAIGRSEVAALGARLRTGTGELPAPRRYFGRVGSSRHAPPAVDVAPSGGRRAHGAAGRLFDRERVRVVNHDVRAGIVEVNAAHPYRPLSRV